MQGENAKKVCGFDEKDMKTYSCRRGLKQEHCNALLNSKVYSDQTSIVSKHNTEIVNHLQMHSMKKIETIWLS